MTLTCVMYDLQLKKKIENISPKVVNSFNLALHYYFETADSLFRKGCKGSGNDLTEPFLFVMRCFNSACSFWIGLDLNGALLIENSRADFKRSRLSSGGIRGIKGIQM